MSDTQEAIQLSSSTVRVFSPRLNEYIEVSLSAENPDDDQLAGIQVVMLVSDPPPVEGGTEPDDKRNA